MKPLPCPGGRGPHQWAESWKGIACKRCGLDTRMLDTLRRAQVESEFQSARAIRPSRPGVIITPMGPPIVQPEVKILGVKQ